MKKVFRCVITMLLCLCVLPLAAQAAEDSAAEDISGMALVTGMEGLGNGKWLFDGIGNACNHVEGNSSLTLEDERGIGSLYLLFDVEYGEYTVTNNDTGEVFTRGQEGFLHEFIPLEDAPRSVTISFDHGPVELNEIYVFTPGQVPDFVQKWQLPKDGQTDLVLFSTHGDDEHLFFGGILPYYGTELGYQVQVVYLTNHRNLTNNRCHEMLNGLWAVGSTTYPVFGHFNDYFSRSKEDAYSLLARVGTTEEEMLSFVVEQLRRFKPKVAVGHDPINGEYRHGAHMLYADLLMKALDLSNDPDQFPKSAEAYGTWDVPKTYLHLYPENQMVMDWDQPLSSFDGMTAYEVSKDLGFICHLSQYRDFAWYIAGMKTAAQIPKYNPREFGLYRTTVGLDVEKNDFFENVTTYAQDAQLRAEEEARQLEAQRQAEEAQRIAQEELERQQAAQLAAQQLQQKQIQERNRVLFIGIIGFTSLILVVLLSISFYKHLRKK